MGRISNDQFVVQLGKLFERTKAKGSVFITSKKAVQFVKKGERGEVDGPKVVPAVPGAVLVRATAGSTKISTVVSQTDLFKFHAAYMSVVRQQMTSLKKKERKARPKKGTAAGGSASASTENTVGAKSPSTAPPKA